MEERVILVTGASGFIGSAITVDLCRDSAIVAVDRRPPTDALRERASGVVWHGVDIADERSLATVFDETRQRWGRLDCVLHFAAYFHFGIDWRAEYRLSNIDGTANVVRLAAETGARRLLFASSLIATEPAPEGGVLTERSPTSDYIPYAKSKAIGERTVLEAVDRLPSIVLRLGGVFSDWCELPPLYSLIELWAGSWPWRRMVIGRGDTGFPYIHRSDVVRLVRACLDRDRQLDRHEVLLACQQGTVRHRDLFDTLQQARRRSPAAPIHVPPAAARLGVGVRSALGRIVGRVPFERAWMLRYADRPWIADTSYTRERLGWDCAPGRSVCQRLPVLLEHLAEHPRQWRQRRRARADGSYRY